MLNRKPVNCHFNRTIKQIYNFFCFLLLANISCPKAANFLHHNFMVQIWQLMVLINLKICLFSCDGRVEGGYYADPEFQCQAFHICARGSETGLIKYSFLCPNGSLFYQQYFICDYWFNVDCSQAEASCNEDSSKIFGAGCWYLIHDFVATFKVLVLVLVTGVHTRLLLFTMKLLCNLT